MSDTIERVVVHLVSAPVPGGLADATRKVESIGFTIVRIFTANGVEGIGVTYHEVGGEATKTLIDKAIAPRLIGRDPFDTEVLWQEFFGYLRGVGRKGLTFGALSAVDIALWDIKGKTLNLPLYKLFGGGRTSVPVYASGGWTSYSDEQLVDEAQMMVDRGYSKVKVKVGVEAGTNPRRDVIRVKKLREALGPDVALLLDANNCWDAATGARFANRVAEYDPLLIEEPVFADDIPGLARFKRSTDIPLGTGEHEYTRFGVRDLLLADAVDIVQADGTRAGGFTEMLKIAALTQAWNVGFAPHAMENIHLHLVAAAPNGLFLERLLLFEEVTSRVFADAPVPIDGQMHIPDLPGLGLNLDLDYVLANDEGTA
ncbi:mandelate racemase/muconate lactonizing enzyme family protein [Tessaracoccus palaemonis]|uniref:Mandelate racemase/muconate lactonizing enzyme family protein n=1 Tax=Tessaracoccus palaemonis TaxID=2829499 RepID=A0ABX8SMU6_9ACTN|nr:mandelate racemase/muconate lactonizing enzyme family protein [Tessaracoccus palaemonis]QXT63722.1 mandelate racemase/muconate lactonizing enzyme family protein [Tessaracoccus palaemonis]